MPIFPFNLVAIDSQGSALSGGTTLLAIYFPDRTDAISLVHITVDESSTRYHDQWNGAPNELWQLLRNTRDDAHDTIALQLQGVTRRTYTASQEEDGRPKFEESSPIAATFKLTPHFLRMLRTNLGTIVKNPTAEHFTAQI